MALRLFFLSATLLVVTGCVGTLNPHVTLCSTKKASSPCKNPDSSIPNAFQYADHAIVLYTDAMGANARWQSIAAVTSVSLTAGALSSSLTGGSDNASTWFGISGATAYGLGSFLTSRPRRLVYAQGVAAITCAKHAMIPYRISDIEEAHLDHAIELLSSTTRYQDPGGSGNKFAENYQGILEIGLRLQSQLNQAATLMTATIDRINGQVNAALASATPDLSAVPLLVDSIVKSQQQMGTPAAPTEPSDPNARRQQTNADNAFGTTRLLPAAGFCSTTQDCATTIHRLVRRFSSTLPMDTLKTCGVDPDVLAIISILPDDAPVAHSGSEEVVIKRFANGGSGRYVAGSLQQHAGAPKLEQPAALSSELRIVIPPSTAAGMYQFYVEDAATGNKAFIRLTIEESDSRTN